jgi:hypothetical protein
MKKNPFGRTKAEIVPLYIPGEKTIYLQRVGAITPNVSPVDLQDLIRKRAEITAIVLESLSNYQKQEKVDEQTARDKFFPSQMDSNTAIVAANPMDYLSIESRTRLLELQSDNSVSADEGTVSLMQIRAATLLLKYRLAYEVAVTEPSNDSRYLKVEEPWFDINFGDRVRFSGCELTVSEPYNPDKESIGFQGSAQMVEPGSVGFLVRGKNFVIGNPEWSEEDTKQYCSIATIKMLWAFYEAELSGKSLQPTLNQPNQADSSSPSQSSLKPSEDKQKAKRSTGVKSTGDSNSSDATTTDSDTKILEASQIG